MQFALQVPNLLRGVLQFGQGFLQCTPRLLFFIPAPLEMVQNKTNDGKSQETDEAVPIPNYFMGVVMLGEDIHKKPRCPAQDCHAERPDPSQIPAAHADRDEVENKQKALVAGRSEERRVGKECRSRWSP